MRTIIFIIWCLALGSTDSLAQISLKLPTSIFAVSAAADWVSTARLLSSGGVENNPLLRPSQDHHTALLAVGIASDVVGVWAWHRWVGRKHPKIARAGLYMAAGFRLFLAVRNGHQMGAL